MTLEPQEQLHLLIEKADSALALFESAAEEQLNAISDYSEFFKRFQEEVDLASISEDQLAVLNEKHALVLRQAKTLETRISDDMKGLRTKGKAVLKYLDVLPKRISSRRPRKG